MARLTVSNSLPRARWRGRLVLDLVSVPVAAYNAAGGRDQEIRFHQLHAGCHSRVRHEKVCPIHGELSSDEIVLGYEFQPDRYVEVQSDELTRLRTQSSPLLILQRFIHLHDLDPIYYDGRVYYLVPEDQDAAEPYAVLHTAMEHQDVNGVGEIVLSGREQMVLVRPWRGLLTMHLLRYPSQLRQTDRFIDNTSSVSPSVSDATVAESLIAALGDEAFDLEDYEDVYQRKLRSLIDAKLAGNEAVAAPLAETPPQVIQFSEALRRSAERARLARMQLDASRRRTVPRIHPP